MLRAVGLTLVLVGFLCTALAAYRAGSTSGAVAAVMLGIVNWLLF